MGLSVAGRSRKLQPLAGNVPANLFSRLIMNITEMHHHNKALMPPRRIKVLKAGSHYKAFFDGDGTTVTFGVTPHEATSKLKFEEKYGHA
jgi:hypothetical protein